MTGTPRTDALCPEPNAVPFSKAVPLLELARTLERELAAALQDAQTLRNLRIDLNERIEEMRGQLASVTAERDALTDVLLRSGFVRCDIRACNCGSWHHRYGFPERMQEIRDALREADVLNNETGNLPLKAIEKLVAERDALQAKVDALMLEYCPDEMTPEQVEEWAKHQVPVDGITAARQGS